MLLTSASSYSLETHYPAIFAYHRSLAVMLAARGLHFLFGAFAAFCLNLGGRVACLRHRDKHNLGPGLCGGIAALLIAFAQLTLHSDRCSAFRPIRQFEIRMAGARRSTALYRARRSRSSSFPVSNLHSLEHGYTRGRHSAVPCDLVRSIALPLV